jgi:hypothetical protein
VAVRDIMLRLAVREGRDRKKRGLQLHKIVFLMLRGAMGTVVLLVLRGGVGAVVLLRDRGSNVRERVYLGQTL